LIPLHVANGHCTTGLIELSGVPGRTAVWADPLNEGPVCPGNVSDGRAHVQGNGRVWRWSNRAGHLVQG
jgi:hypothetical protein